MFMAHASLSGSHCTFFDLAFEDNPTVLSIGSNTIWQVINHWKAISQVIVFFIKEPLLLFCFWCWSVCTNKLWRCLRCSCSFLIRRYFSETKVHFKDIVFFHSLLPKMHLEDVSCQKAAKETINKALEILLSYWLLFRIDPQKHGARKSSAVTICSYECFGALWCTKQACILNNRPRFY